MLIGDSNRLPYSAAGAAYQDGRQQALQLLQGSGPSALPNAEDFDFIEQIINNAPFPMDGQAMEGIEEVRDF